MLKTVFNKFKTAIYYTKQYLNAFKVNILEKIVFIKTYVNYKLIYSNRKVAIGTIFNHKGGVTNHILALNKYLSTSISTVPYFKDSSLLGKGDRINRFKNWCNDYTLLSNEVLHSHADTWFIQYCRQQQVNRTIKWVHTYHLPYFEECHGKFLDWQVEMNQVLFDVAHSADIKISVGKWLRDYLQEQHNISSIYIPNCVDFEKCQQAEANRFVERFNLKDFILFASKLDYVKNPLEFVQLSAMIPDEQFVMIGSNITAEALIKLYGKDLPSNLNVVSGYLEHETLLDAIAASRVFVMTSRMEGLPTALMEAMALAKPVVASRVHGCEELLESGEYGFLYELGNLEDLTTKTLSALTNSEIGPSAQKHIKANFDWKVVAPQIDKIYADLING
jgi:glycosyltransferase involved in cell wall biosynthesis